MSDGQGNASQNGDGTGNGAGAAADQKPTWIEQLPEGMRADESLYGFKTIGDLVTAHKATMTERDSRVQVPGEGATAEERAAFYTKLGRPETADKYSFKKPDNLPEGMSYDPQAETAYRAIFHELGLSDAQASALWGKYHEMVSSGFTANAKAEQEAYDKAISTLKDEWKGDAFKVNTEIAARAFKKFGGDDNAKFLEETKINGLPLGNHPVLLKLFHAIGIATGEDKAMTDRGTSGREMSDEERARARFPKTKFPET